MTAPKAGLGTITWPGTTATLFTTVYGYDDGQHHQTLFGYDQNGNRTQVTDANNNTTVSSYDALNRLVQVCQPFVTGTSQVCAPGNGHPAVTVLQYDASDNLTGQVSPRGYDAAPKSSFRGDAAALAPRAGRKWALYARRPRCGRPGQSPERQELIVRLAQENPR